MADVILSGKQPVFVAMWVENEARPKEQRLSATQVAINAGVAEKSAHVYAANALANPKIQQAIAERKRKLAEAAAGALDVDAARVIREWAEIAIADPTDIVTVRRLCCRHCWGFGFGYQYTDAEYARETAEAMEGNEDLSRFTGGPGFRHTREPNPECPECSGEGVEDVHIRDLRKLKGPARKLIAGVKMGKYGPEVQMRDQDAALRNLAGFLGVLRQQHELSGPGGGAIPVAAVNYNLPADPAEAARVYQALMEGKTV